MDESTVRLLKAYKAALGLLGLLLPEQNDSTVSELIDVVQTEGIEALVEFEEEHESQSLSHD